MTLATENSAGGAEPLIAVPRPGGDGPMAILTDGIVRNNYLSRIFTASSTL